MRVVATPLSLKTASSSRRTMVSILPRLLAGLVVRGTPLNRIVPVKGFEPAQKNPAGMGSLAKLAWARPATVIQRSAPFWMGSVAKAALAATRTRTAAAATTVRRDLLIHRSFLGLR